MSLYFRSGVRFVVLRRRGEVHAIRRDLFRSRRMVLVPECLCNLQRLDTLLLPPTSLIAAPVQLVVMQPAERDCEAVTHLAAGRPVLCELDVMGIGRRSPADET